MSVNLVSQSEGVLDQIKVDLLRNAWNTGPRKITQRVA
jgi:hypothetical protein